MQGDVIEFVVEVSPTLAETVEITPVVEAEVEAPLKLHADVQIVERIASTVEM